MAVEEKQIPTITTVTSQNSEVIIHTRYVEDELPNTIMAEILELPLTQNGVSGINGELMIEMINYSDKINYIIDNMGNLVVLTSTGDSNNYSIDNNGELVYTY